jgi:predicted  nucleic acid-binding Zn-ribbon protein
MSQIFKLFRLQQIDSQLDSLRARMQEIERLLSQDESLRRAQAERDSAAGQAQEARKALRRAEENVSAQRIKIEQTEATLYGGKVRNPKELQDMQNETASLKKYLAVLEDRQLEGMLAVEEAEAAETSAGERLEGVRHKLARQHATLLEEQARLKSEAERAEIERQVTVAEIPAGELQLYDQLRKQRRGVAVAKIANKACAACGTTLSAALLHTARVSPEITRCDTCGRILYSG